MPHVSTPVPTYVFTGTLRVTIFFVTAQVRVLEEDGYDTQEVVLYWKFTEINNGVS